MIMEVIMIQNLKSVAETTDDMQTNITGQCTLSGKTDNHNSYN